jgi:TPR repeat protein
MNHVTRMLGLSGFRRVVMAGAALISLTAFAGNAFALERRVAFVVGNSAYTNVPALPNPRNDAEAVAASLRTEGFEVITAFDLSQQAFDAEFQRFVRSLNNADVSMFYYSGHGIQIGGDNRIIPVDAAMASANDMEVETVSLRTIMTYMQANSKSQLVYLDSCRNNPFRASTFMVGPDKELALSGQGMAEQEASLGSLVAFSTQPGNVAVDGLGDKSPFTEAVIRHSFTLGVDVQTALMKVTQEVWDTTRQRQRPWSSSTLVEPVFLAQPSLLIAFDEETEPQKPADVATASPDNSAPTTAQNNSTQTPTLAFQLASLISENFQKPKRVPIGVGAVAMLGDTPIIRAQTSARVEFEKLPEKGVLYLDGKALKAGSIINEDALKRVSFEPSIGSQGSTDTIAIRIAQADGQSAVVEGKVEPYLTDCDRLAGEPLDLQGVTPGVLPNEIDARQALAACSSAITEFPDVARYAYQLGRAKFADRDVVGAKALFEQAAKMGHVRAYYQLGNLALRGSGQKQDLAEANRLLKFGAEQGDPFAMVSYGRNLVRGRGLPKDVKGGTALLNKAVEMGHTFAMNELGSMYYYGRGVKENWKRGVRFYEAALARNDIYAMNNIALAYAQGKGVKKDMATALGLYKRASEGGHPSAPTNVGIMYYNGSGVKKNTSKAIEWYAKGAERGDSFAASNLAWIYSNGPKSERNPEKAVWYSALSKALDSFGDNPKAGAELKTLSRKMKTAAIKVLTTELGEKMSENTSDVDGILIQLARKAWQKRNPRYDLF